MAQVFKVGHQYFFRKQTNHGNVNFINCIRLNTFGVFRVRKSAEIGKFSGSKGNLLVGTQCPN